MKTRIRTGVPGKALIEWVDVDIVPGDMVLLHWDGYRHVPLWLDGSWATVLSVNEKRQTLRVQSHREAEYPRTILPQHISKLEKGTK